ncbi:MAG: FAD-binding oxidoreductase [Candidatus Thiodiazotropha sp. (ex Monitilora ramsayi)]|nr:FAD-binding oxidoreductase [Candidatus Thiodiazotropha sp. (ex Monitilora ramsayi)]
MQAGWSVLLLFTIFAAPSFGGDLKPFTTDGCSVFPDGTPEQQSLWAECCIHHDLAYWKGGTYEERLQADQLLEACVAQLGQPQIAQLMLAGVRVGGSPYFPTAYRWGYGWPYQRGYQTLSEKELAEVAQQISNLQSVLDRFSSQLEIP